MLTQLLQTWARNMARRAAQIFVKTPITPNMLTLFGLVLNIGVAVLIATGHLVAGGVMVIVAGLFDMLDGALARITNKMSAFGAFLDSVVDRYSDLLVLLGIVLFYERGDDTVGVFFTMIALVGTVMVSYTKARAQSVGVSCDIGLMERPERMIVLIGGGLFNLLTPTMIALAVLTNVTAVQRILHVRRLG